jgi:phosphinothricin acetyltransferase
MIRPAVGADAPGLLAIYNPLIRDTRITFETELLLPREMAARIDKTRRTLPFFVAEAADCIVGYAYASPHRARSAYRWSVETSIFVHPDHHGHGWGRRLTEAVLTSCEELGYRRALAGVALPNDASIGLHRALGFTDVGVYEAVGFKAGRWVDVRWMQKAVGNPSTPPRETLRWRG